MSLPLANGYLFMCPSFIIGTWGSKLRNLGDWSWPTWPPPIVDLLTHWPLGDLTVILHVWFLHSFYWLTPGVLHVKLLSVECHRVHWHFAIIGSGNGLLPSMTSVRVIYTCIERYWYGYPWCIVRNFFGAAYMPPALGHHCACRLPGTKHPVRLWGSHHAPRVTCILPG